MIPRPTPPTRAVSRRAVLRGGAGALGLAAMPWLLSACGVADSTATPAPAADGGGVFRVGYVHVSVIEPHLLADTAGQAVVLPTAAWLVDVDRDLQVVPGLATEWSSEDAQRWTFTLREGLRFHRGDAFTAEDVVATWTRLVDPAAQSTLLGTLDFLPASGIRALDDRTIEFTLTRPVSDFPVYTHSYQAGILPASYQPGDFGANADGLGPFALEEYRPQGDVRYRAHPGYHVPGQPAFAELTLAGYAGEDAILPALLAGDVDASVLTEFAQLPVLRGREDVIVHHLGDARHIALTMRVDRDPWTDKRVRQALALSVGRRAYIDGVLAGVGDVGEDHPVAPLFREHAPLPGARERDVEAARRLLAEAGVPTPVAVTLSAPAEIADLADLAVYVADQAREAGFAITVETLPIAQFFERSADLDFQTYGWGHRNTPSEFLKAGYRTGGAFNVTAWSNSRFDELDRTVDLDRRRAITLEIEELMADEVPAVVLFWAGQYRATRADISGFEPSAALLMPVATARRIG